MAFQILLNLFLSFVWMFLKDTYDFTTFLVGYFFGLLILYVFKRFLKKRFYFQRVLAIVKLFLIFMRELILSNIAVLKVVLSPKLDIQPGIFEMETTLKNDWEITVLANLITLTPGTLVVDVSDDNRTLYVHAMDIDNVEEEISGIKNTFEKAIAEVTR